MAKILLAYVPCKNEKEANSIAKALVKGRLVGCCNIVPKIQSYYWWKGKLTKSAEALLLCKFPAKNKKKFQKMVKQLHSYKVPCIAFFEVKQLDKSYLSWLLKETR